MLTQFLQFLMLGIVLGGVYALFSIGLSLVFGVLDVINVAHGEFYTIGGFVTFVCIGLWALGPVTAMVATFVIAFAVGAITYRLLIVPLVRRLGRRDAGTVYLVATLGLSTFLQNSILGAAGADYRTVPNFVSGSFSVLGVTLSAQRWLVLVLATALLVALFAWLRWTRPGRAIRAVAQNPAAAQAVGIDLNWVFLITFGIAAGLAGLGGALIGPLTRVYPAMGFTMTIKAFAITVAGGMGHLPGTLLASYLVGVAESMAVMFISSEWRDLVAFAVMILVLMARPEGLLGKGRAG